MRGVRRLLRSVGDAGMRESDSVWLGWRAQCPGAFPRGILFAFHTTDMLFLKKGKPWSLLRTGKTSTARFILPVDRDSRVPAPTRYRAQGWPGATQCAQNDS